MKRPKSQPTNFLPLALTLTITSSVNCISEETRIRMEEIQQQRLQEEIESRENYRIQVAEENEIRRQRQLQLIEEHRQQTAEWNNNTNAYRVSEEGLSLISTDCTVTQNNSRIGRVEETIISIGAKLTYYDTNRNCVAFGEQEVISVGNEINIYTCTGELIGTIEERIIESFFSISTTYSIRNAQNREIAVSSATHFLGSEFTIRTSNNQTVIMTADNQNIISDDWNLRISRASTLPDAFYILLISFKTYADNQAD